MEKISKVVKCSVCGNYSFNMPSYKAKDGSEKVLCMICKNKEEMERGKTEE